MEELVSDLETEHWQRITRVEADLDAIKPQVASLQTDVSYIRQSMEQLLQKNQQPTQWGAIASLATLVVVIMGGFTTLISQPISNRADVNGAHIQQLEELLNRQSVLNAEAQKGVEWHQSWIQSLEDQNSDQHNLNIEHEGRISALEAKNEKD